MHMYRKFKSPFFSARSYIAEPASRQAHVRLVKPPVLLRLTWAAQRSERRDLFFIAPLARTQSERLRRLALATGFGSSDCLE